MILNTGTVTQPIWYADWWPVYLRKSLMALNWSTGRERRRCGDEVAAYLLDMEKRIAILEEKVRTERAGKTGDI